MSNTGTLASARSSKKRGISGSNSLKSSKSKSKGKITSNEAEDCEESRNNLYWVNGQNFFCLWYGNMSLRPEEIISVLPIRCDDVQNVVIVSCLNAKSQTSSSQYAPSSSGADRPAITSNLFNVKRRNLIPLDEEVLQAHCKDPLTRDFARSLLEFAEWDFNQRDSYVWPDFIHDIMISRQAMEKWFNRASLHPISARIGTGEYGRSKMFLFLLIIEHLGMQSGYLATDTFENDRRIDSSSTEVLDLLYKVATSKGIDPNNSDDFIRSSSRMGSQFQVSLNDIDLLATDNGAGPVSSKFSIDSKSSLVFRPDMASDDECAAYLAEISVLRFKYVRVGHIVEAPETGYTKRLGLDGWKLSTCCVESSVLPETPGTARRNGTRYTLCTILHISRRESTFNSDTGTPMVSDPENSHTSISSIEGRLSLTDEAVVYDGMHNWTIPLNLCRQFTLPEDESLELLHSCNYDYSLAIKKAEQKLSRKEQILRYVWSASQIDLFLRIARRHPRNIRKLWKRFCDPAREVAKAATESNPILTQLLSGVDAVFKSIKDILNFYFLFFQGIADSGEDGDGDGDSYRSSRLFNALGSRPSDNDALFSDEIECLSAEGQHRKERVNGFLSINTPNRWPKALPVMPHNLYWLRANSSPCVCVGLEPISGLLRVIPICSGTYHHEVKVSSTTLEPLTEMLLKSSSDERAAGFAGAMKDFAEWELDKWPANATVCRWYEYPKFMLHFLCHNPTFSAWRKQSERSLRGKGEERRTVYFESLKETFLTKNESEDDRFMRHGQLPWNDAPADSSDDESIHDVSDSSHEYDTTIIDDKPVGKSRTSKSGSKKEPPPPPPPAPKPLIPYSRYSMFWLPRSNLACLFYDDFDVIDRVEFTVLPVCCSTYHYSVKVSYTAIEPLTVENLRSCTDERTHDFSLALMDFAEWDIGRGWSGENPVEFSASNEEIKYLWPSFILDLISSPREWAAWRKRVERNPKGTRSTRKNLYLAALCDQFLIEANVLRAEDDERNNATIKMSEAPTSAKRPRESEMKSGSIIASDHSVHELQDHQGKRTKCETEFEGSLFEYSKW